jgi:hypothetical protein
VARSLVVNIVGDQTSLERALKKSERSVKRFQGSVEKTSRQTNRSFSGMGKGLVGLGAGLSVTAALKSSITAASDLEQQVGKTSVVFGDSAKEVEAWSKTVDTAFGLSQREALTTASNFGALFAPIGLTGEAAAKQSIKLTQLGADLASFYNTDVQSALDAVRSGLVGEAEPLRKYGVLLSETRVQQEALRQTGKKHTADLTVQEKALARINIIYRDSKTAQGDFTRTSKTAANQAKIMQANIENLKAELATGLIPALADAAAAFNKFFDAMSDDNLKKHNVGFLGEGLLQNVQDLRARVMGDRARRHPLPGTKGRLPGPKELTVIDQVAKALEAALKMEKRAGPRKGKGPTKAELADRRSRIRQAAEAARQGVLDRAEFNVEKTGATKTLKDDLAALRHYNALLTRRIKGGHGTLELEREQFHVQMQIADVLKQQSDLAKKTKKRLGVDVTRFQASARGQLVTAGTHGAGRGVVISGGVHLHGIQNVGQLENELTRRSKQRAHHRRGRR